MATTATTPDLQTMPLNELRELASQPPAPEPEAPAPAPEPIAASTEPKPYEMTKTDDGQVEVKLQTGEVFKGDPYSVMQKLAEAKVNTTLHYRAKETAPPAPPAPEPVPAQSDIERQQFNSQFLDSLAGSPEDAVTLGLARKLGTTPDVVVQTFNKVAQLVENYESQALVAEFHQKAPDFPATDEAAAQLIKVIETAGVPPTTQNLLMAHAYCVQNKLYSPLTPEQIQAAMGNARTATQAAPPPVVTPHSPAQVGGQPTEDELRSMPLDQLRKLALGK